MDKHQIYWVRGFLNYRCLVSIKTLLTRISRGGLGRMYLQQLTEKDGQCVIHKRFAFLLNIQFNSIRVQ